MIQCLQSFTFSKTSMSLVFNIFKEFNVFCLLHFQRLQGLLFFTFARIQSPLSFTLFETPMSAIFYAFRDFNVFCFTFFLRLHGFFAFIGLNVLIFIGLNVLVFIFHRTQCPCLCAS